MGFPIILVSLFFLLSHTNLCSGFPGAGIPPQYNTQCENFIIKSDCLRVYCDCGWCENVDNSSKLLEKGISNKHGGVCFTYDDDPIVNIKNCGSANVTIHTYVNSKYCKNLEKVGYIFAYIIIGLASLLVFSICTCAVVCFIRDHRLARRNRVNIHEMSIMDDL